MSVIAPADQRPPTPLDCPVCAHADRTGWWGQNGTHCRKCHRSWTAFGEGHCVGGGPNDPGCCRHFSATINFDAHLVEGRCVDPGSLVVGSGAREGEPRFKLVDRASGPVWVGAGEYVPGPGVEGYDGPHLSPTTSLDVLDAS